MLRKLQAFFVLGVWGVAVPAAAQESPDEPTSKVRQADAEPAAPEGATDKPGSKSAADKPASESAADKPASEGATDKPASDTAAIKLKYEERQSAHVTTAPAVPPPAAEGNSAEQSGGWHTFVSGYFRAPLTLGFSPRPGPDNQTGPKRLQVSYGPNRLIDSNYYSFAYTRLQEQDWAELFVHAKKKHAEAVIGWMGYWLQGAGYRNADATWAPGAAYLTLDTDFELGGLKPNIALTVGAWWPKFGTFDKYDTYTLGRFRQLGEQVKLTLPFNPDVTVTLVQGFGTNRNGSFNYSVNPPLYGGTTGADLIHYDNVQVTFKKYLDLGLHFNTQWTRDPNLTQQTELGPKSYEAVTKAYLMTIGGEVTVSAPYAGRLWVSPSYIKVRNGWALANGGVEVMHSLGAADIATNYLALTNSTQDSSGTGSMMNLGFLYENSLSGIQDKPRGTVMPDLTLNVFGLLADVSLDLPAGTKVTQDHITQLKYGADLTLQTTPWLGLMARFDQVNYDMDNGGYVFSAITGRLIFSTHFLSSESIYLQYSRYRYGDYMTLNGTWPWGQDLVQGSHIFQSGPYSGTRPDMDVIKIQAQASF